MTTDEKTYYIDETVGEDSQSTAGTAEKPFKTVSFAFLQHSEAQYLVRDGDEWKSASKSALKKAKTFVEGEKKKAAKAQELAIRRQKEDEERQKVLDNAKKMVITEDTSLPKAVKIKLYNKDVKLRKVDVKGGSEVSDNEAGQRVRVFGRVHRARKQKDILFITLRDGYGFLQVVAAGNLAKSYDALTLTLESSIEVTGEMYEVPPGAHAPDNRELHADFFRVIPWGKAAGGDDAITNRISKDTEHSILLDLRHLTLRGETASALMEVRDAVEWAFNQVYHELRLRKVSPPALVQCMVEGGSTLFGLKYYNEEAYLTQSSQLYLETCLPSLGDVYCIEKSFRAEKSLTRRHLAEYTHIEAELDFITFDDLLDHLETVMCRVIEVTLSDPIIKDHVMKLNPEFQMPAKPFMRMKYVDAIKWLNDHEIPNEEGKPHQFGDDIAEAAERKMTDEINRPIFLTHFPVEIKSFYMMKDKEDKRVTESVDCLMPGVGEIVGGSMRIYDYDELMAAYEREHLDPSPYYWYTDQRKYGGSPHGGYGLGLERFLAWLCKQHTVRDTSLYPRYFTRCKP